MKKSLLNSILCFHPYKLISVLFILFIVNSSLLTVNCYSQWVQQSLPISINRPIKGIRFIDTLKGWAISGVNTQQDTSYIIRTSSGGSIWDIQYLGSKQGLYCLSILNDTIGYVGGTDFVNSPITTPLLLKTTTGGMVWNRLTVSSATMYPNDICFQNKDSGWVCCLFSGPDVRTTTDGGQTWQVRTNGINATTDRLFFLNYSTGYCAAHFDVYKTTNAGLNWTLIGNFPSMVKSLFFLNENTGWAGTDINKIYYTNNSGINWILQTPPPNSSSTVYDIYFLNQNTGWAGTGFNKVFKTTNGGINWGYQVDTSGSYRISILDSIHGWSAQFGISRTINGGGSILAVEQISTDVPNEYSLYQNYPNPFNPETRIEYRIMNRGAVELVVYDVLGRKTAELVKREQTKGTYRVSFDGSTLSNGVYFYMFTVDGNIIDTKKMILLK